MLMKKGERWRCTSAACQCAVLVECNGQIEGSNPRCACGGIMKKNYTPPSFTYLEFLRIEDPVAAHKGSREE